MTACSTGFQRPSCLQRSLKFLQPNLAPRSLSHSFSPSSECSSVYCSVPAATATTKQARAQVPGAHGQRRTHPQGAA